MSNVTQNHSHAKRKDRRQRDVSENRKDEFDDANKKDKKHTNKIRDWENEVDGMHMSNDQTPKIPKILDPTPKTPKNRI